MLAGVGDDADRKPSQTHYQKAIAMGMIGSVCIAPPGLRRVGQFGDNCDLEDVVYDDVGEAMLPQYTQCEKCLSAHLESHRRVE